MKRRVVAMTAIVVSFLLLTSVPAWTQGLAEAARQERDRKREQSARERHVYTNEDLTKPQILVPEDQARVLARKNEASPAVEASLPSGPSVPATPVQLPMAVPAIAVAETSKPASMPVPVAPAVMEGSIPSALWSMENAKPILVARNSHLQPQTTVPPIVRPIVHDAQTLTTIFAVQNLAPSLAPAISMLTLDHSVATARDSRLGPKALVPPAIGPIAHEVQALTPTLAVQKPVPGLASAVTVSRLERGVAASDSRLQLQAPVPPTIRPVAHEAQSLTSALAVQKLAPSLISAVTTSTLEHAAARDSHLQPQAIVPPAIRPATHEVGALAPALAVQKPVPSVATVASAERVVATRVPVPAQMVRSVSCTEPCGSPKIAILAPVMPKVQPVVDRSSLKPAMLAEHKAVEPASPVATSAGTAVLVQLGDSLWKLAARYLGNGERWHEVAKLNPHLVDPAIIRVGEWIQIPSQVPQETRQIVVHPGDTLWSVAQTALGSPLAFNCIAHANPQLQSADAIRAGQTLVVPEACAVAR